MSNPFKDQFLKKGLVTKKQVNKVSHEQRLSVPKKRNKKMPETDEQQNRIQQTSHERKFFVDGDRLPVFEWNGIKLGMLICMDMRYPEMPVVSSAQAAAVYISENYGKCRCLVVGEKGIEEELKKEGHDQ